MPSIGATIGGTITFLIGSFVFLFFKDYGQLSYDTDFRYPWENWKQPWYYQIGAFVAGIVFICLGLNTLKFGVLSILMLIPAIPVLFHFKLVGRVLMVFFSRREPTERAIVNGQYILLILILVWITGAVYFTVKDWVAIAAE